MQRIELENILNKLVTGEQSLSEVLDQLTHWPILGTDAAQVDTQRPLRNGFSEVIFAEGKSEQQLTDIVERLLQHTTSNILATRVDSQIGNTLCKKFPSLHYDETSRTLLQKTQSVEPLSGRLAILAAGTSDIPVAEEVRRTAQFFGAEAETHYDVGVAGIHRLFVRLRDIADVDVVVVVAGMEGALPSVVGGLIAAPIIAVPTSVGYGTHLQGLTTLFAMLNSCSEGISVVNINNGFGAACAAVRILRKHA